jgi:hypothetical protein
MHENVMNIYKKYKKWNQSLAPACLESVQEGKGEIRYQFRQCSIVTKSTAQGNQTMDFFKVFEYQVDMSAKFDPPSLRLGGMDLPPGGGVKRESELGPGPGQATSFYLAI